jgi:two-component system phosphate regulon sensor histidine kinase PhoR
MMYVALPVDKPGMPKTVIRLSVPLTEIANIEAYFLRYIIAAVLVGLLISSVVAFSIVRNITRPIKEMTVLSSEIAEGDYGRRINLDTKDEVGQLAHTFNDMAEKLEVTINDLSDKNNKLEAVLTSIQSGILALDATGKIILINPAAASMFDFKGNPLGKHFLEVIRNVELEDIISNRHTESREIRLSYPEKRVLRVKVTPIKNNGSSNLGVVAVLQDITELKQLEQMRSEFVANVSHELKTPLTSIKGFAETLKSGAVTDDAARERFLDIINIEADRLTRLINDILTISELETGKYNGGLEKVDINRAAEEIDEMMDSLAKLKKIDLSIIKPEDDILVMGNHDRIKQLLINLIDNSIKYTNEGGSVTVKNYRQDTFVIIEVSDTGIGISKEHLKRLFERFYRVDKGRSRSMGGTGLGLAIVKHIAISMDGDVEVFSEPGKGTTFKVRIPAMQAEE